MKRKVMILMIGVLLISGSVFAQGDIFIDLNGNIEAGAAAAGRLEVQGDNNRDGIVGVTGGSGKAVHGINPSGLAGYFDGNVQVTGGLSVVGTVSGTGVGDITAVNAGTGLSGGETSGAVTLDADTTYLQQRVTGSCLGQVMVSINQDGTVVCETDDTGGGGGSGDITAVNAGTGLTGGGTSGDVTLNVDSNVYYSKAEVDNLIQGLQDQITLLQDKLAKVTVSGDDIYITGANLHVRSSGSSTDDTVDGTGNIIVGFNEVRGSGSDKTGSHNLIVGQNHNYSSYGGIVAGYENTISAPYASVSGGQYNTASGSTSSISGGAGNTASAIDSSISGGQENTVTVIGNAASVSGGAYNTASNATSTVSGGRSNTSSGLSSSVSGGQENTASGERSSVSGGWQDSVSGKHDWRAGGFFQPD